MFFFVKTKTICENILLKLIQCELLVPKSFRLKLSQLIAIYMPFIQVNSKKKKKISII